MGQSLLRALEEIISSINLNDSLSHRFDELSSQLLMIQYSMQVLGNEFVEMLVALLSVIADGQQIHEEFTND